MQGKIAAIYHFTDRSTKRPKIYKDQIKVLEEYANSLGFEVTEIFCDNSLRRCDRTEFDRFLTTCKEFNVLITKDFYHISKNTMRCMNIMKDLRNKGISIYTQKNGIFIFENEPFDKYLNIATYNSRFGTPNELKQIVPVQNDILKLFTKQKTNWTVIDQYFDESEHQIKGEQIHLKDLISNKDKYDLLLVHNLNDIHRNTSNFCKVREALQMDIYSLQDGFLKYRTEVS